MLVFKRFVLRNLLISGTYQKLLIIETDLVTSLIVVTK